MKQPALAGSSEIRGVNVKTVKTCEIVRERDFERDIQRERESETRFICETTCSGRVIREQRVNVKVTRLSPWMSCAR